MADACLFILSCYFLFSSEEAVLRQLPRLLRCELQRSLCESHLWLSLWERPHRSPFTRLQRATCCAVLLQFFLLANTLWYSIVVDNRYRYKSFFFSVFVSIVIIALSTGDLSWHLNAILFCSPRAVSRYASLNGETVAAGVVTCLIVYPLYLLVFTLFRMSRSKVPQTCPETITQPRPNVKLNIFSLCLWTLVCVCGAGATTRDRPGVGGNWWLPG